MQLSPPPKSAQDILGQFLSAWRANRIKHEIQPPFLDVACGDNRLVKNIPDGIGVDIVDYGNADHILKDFYHFPISLGSFATITIIASLNYFDKPEQVLAALSKILHPDGKIIITLLDPMIGKIWHKFREPWAKEPGFSYSDIKGIANRAGFELEERKRFMLGLNNLYVLSHSPIKTGSQK